MKIKEVRAELLRMPLPRPMQSGSSSGAKGGPVENIFMPLAGGRCDVASRLCIAEAIRWRTLAI